MEAKDIIIDDLIAMMLNLFNNTNKTLEAERQNLSQIDTELADLDHFLEIRNLKVGEYAKLGKLRKELRNIRRQIKYNIEMLLAIQRFTDKYNNKLIAGDLILLKKKLEEINEKHLNPSYEYKTDILQRGGLIDENLKNSNISNCNMDNC